MRGGEAQGIQSGGIYVWSIMIVINHMEFYKQPYRRTTINITRSSNSLRVDNLDNGGVIVSAPAGTPAVDSYR